MKNTLILLVDDDLDDREIFFEATQQIGPWLKCLTVSNVKEALELLRTNFFRPDFIFTDLRMPAYDGKHFLREIITDPYLNKIPVFIYTTTSSIAQKEQCLKLGAAGFITKPWKLEDIISTIKEVVMPKIQDKKENQIERLRVLKHSRSNPSL